MGILPLPGAVSGYRPEYRNGEIYRFDGSGWERISGQGVRGSWDLATNNLVTSMIAYEGKLLIGYNCQAYARSPDRFGNVLAWEPKIEKWHDLSLPAEVEDRSLVLEQRSFNAFAVYQGHLIVGGGRAEITGNLSLWRLSIPDRRWKSLGRPKMQHFFSAEEAAIWERNEYVYSMALYREDLAVGFRGPDGTADAWRLRKRE